MPQWAAFAGLTGVVLASLLVLARLSQEPLADSGTAPESTTDALRSDACDSDSPPVARSDPGSSAGSDSEASAGFDDDSDPEPDYQIPDGDEAPSPSASLESGAPDLGTATLLANVALTQGLFGSVLVAGAWYARIPPAALGLGGDAPGLAMAVALGVAIGVALYLVNELGAGAADAVGIEHSEALRELLAPDGAVGWLALLGVVLPVIATFEELLFRAALIGALAAGFGVSPWLLAVGSSVAFAVGHGAQGTAGVAVTGLLGFALAAAFVLTGSLVTVVVAHYLVNALEFVVHEALELDRA